MPAIDAVAVGLSYAQTNQLYRNEGDGRYADISARAGPGFQLARVSRGAVYGDVDSDGDLDVVVANLDAAPSLLRNDSDYGHHWLVLQLSGPPGNQYGIGARVSIHVGGRILYRQVFSGDGFMGQHDPRLFVGLGQRRRADLVEVCWPSGVVQSFEDLAADRRYTIDHRDGLR